ncbi:MAG: hypothetical protein ACRC9K_02320 [Afipia sp.]
MNVHPSKLNLSLSNSVRNRIAAEMSYISGVSGFWRAIGVGFVGLGLGVACGLVFYGYSFVTRSSDHLNAMSLAFSKALSDVQLKGVAEGVVQLEPNEISLAKGQEILFDSNSRIQLDPTAKILLDGEIKIQAPTISVPQNVARPVSRIPTITNFTIFKSVPFEKGMVLTGWIFLTSAQTAPTSQYCYYNERGDDPDIALRVDVGNDEVMVASKDVSKSLDVSAAFTKCVWFKKDDQ